MFLSRLLLDPRSRSVRQDLANCHALHRTVMSAFPDVEGPARDMLGVLHRVDFQPRTGELLLLVQSTAQPDWARLPESYLLRNGQPNPACKAVGERYAAIRAGQRFRFRLRANPTRKIDTASGPDGQKRNGRRVDLRDEDSQVAWLKRKGEQHGFSVLSARTSSEKSIGLRTGGRLTFGGVVFGGLLMVQDAESFRAALGGGIGSAKAFGFGLMSIASVAGMEE